MRKKFSERYGYANIRESFQIESIDEDLRNRIWNQFRIYYLDNAYVKKSSHITEDEEFSFYVNIYDKFFKTTRKPSENRKFLGGDIKKLFEQLRWYKIFDFIEFIAETYYRIDINNKFREAINKVLKEEMSAYRFIGNYITPIIDEVEIKEVEEALECEYTPVKQHLSNALEFLSDRENPDYQNSIKESITAVESVAKIITGKETDLVNCLKVMDIDLNKQFKTSMINLYGWTCKEDGIRHGHTGEELKTSFEEAKYMLVSCSAFVNYLISKNS